jgi:hypothetical protein
VHVPPKPYVLPEVPIAELKCEIPCSQDAVKVVRWSEEEKLLRVRTAVPASVTLKLFDYPAWQVEIDGKLTVHESTYAGQIKVGVPPGDHSVRVCFVRTPDRTAGIAMSLLSAVILLGLFYFADPKLALASN